MSGESWYGINPNAWAADLAYGNPIVLSTHIQVQVPEGARMVVVPLAELENAMLREIINILRTSHDRR